MKYLDENGLLYVVQKIKGWLADKADASALNNKVDKVSGKGLSTNDYTTTEKNKLSGIATGAEVNVQSDWNQTDSTKDDYIKNKPTIPDGAKLYSTTGQNTDGAMTQKAVTDAIAGITTFDVQVVTSLPATGVKGVIYLKAHSHGTGDSYDEYIWTGSAFEKIGNTDIDLSGYATTIALTNGLAGKVDKVSGKGLSTNDFTTALKNKLEGIDLVSITNAEIDEICS